MKNLAVMIKPASSLCDMRCTYCFYTDVSASRRVPSGGLMTRETAARLICNVFSSLEAGDTVTFVFQGGEPTLAGLDFYDFFVSEARRAARPGVQCRYAFQTNGLRVDGEWCAFFKRNDFLVGLSLDGDAKIHNRSRMDADGKGTFARVLRAKTLLDEHGCDYNILCVLTAESARRARSIWDFILRERIRHIQFIPCLEPLGRAGAETGAAYADAEAAAETDPSVSSAYNSKAGIPVGSPYVGSAYAAAAYAAALTGERFYRFYSTLYPLWKAAYVRGNYIHVGLFDDLIGLFTAGRPVTCGLSGRCSPQIVVEADGSVYPCDFYAQDSYLAGNLAAETLETVYEAVANSGFAAGEPRARRVCADCTHSGWCHGGCKRMARAVYGVYGEDCGMRRFLDEYLEDLVASRAPSW